MAELAWVDSHCHLPYDGMGDVAATLAEARQSGVQRFVTVGTDASHSASAIEAARAHDGVWATVGLHPHDASEGVDSIRHLFGPPEVVAVGECGLDYHYEHSPRDVQREAFAEQIGLAHELDLALVIHTREAWDDTFDILASEGVPSRTIFHCFTGGPGEARLALDTGAWLSFSGIVTFKNADDVRAAAALCPLDQLLVETDAPYLAPVPHRGQPNRPQWVTAVGQGVAEAKGVRLDAIAHATWEGAQRAFRLPAA